MFLPRPAGPFKKAANRSSMRTDVRNFIHKCPACQFMQSSKLAIHSKRSVHPFNMCVGRPMDRINIDTIGPFPQDEEGNK